ncbi:hypothetical protein M9458_029006, partial [Cirrhinus mrigala]
GQGPQTFCHHSEGLASGSIMLLKSPVTEYFAYQRSSGLPNMQPIITMDPALRLVQLCQDNRSIEEYVIDFCEMCYLVNFKESFLKDIFYFGLCKDISSRMPKHHHHWSLIRYIDFALLLGGSAFTVGITDEGPCDPPVFTKPESVHVMPTTQKPHRTTSATPRPAHVTSVAPGPAHVTSVAAGPAHAMLAVLGPAHIMAARPESRPVTADLPKSSQVTADLPESSQVTADLPESSQVTTDLPESSQGTAALLTDPLHDMIASTGPRQATAVLPEPHQVPSDFPKPRHVSADLLEPRHISADPPEPCQVSSQLPSHAEPTLSNLA